MEGLGQYSKSVLDQVSSLVSQNKCPSSSQLNIYVAQVVTQLHNMTRQAPPTVRADVSNQFSLCWDFDQNKALPDRPVTVEEFTGSLSKLCNYCAAATGKSKPTPQQAPAPVADAGANGYAAPPPQQNGSNGAEKKVSAGFGNANNNPNMRADAAVFVPKGATVVETRNTSRDYSETMKKMPTFEKKDWIIAAIRRNNVTVISGETGCGKSTLIPQLVCDADNLIPEDKVVVCCQPRRVAAITLGEFVAKDRGQELGDEVGYQIRFIKKYGDNTRLIYATTAVVLRRLHSEPDLESIGCIIVDEVHERDVYTDFLLLLVREAMSCGRMKHLKIVLMSATLRAQDFATYFAKINGDLALKPIHVPGRMFPVTVKYFEDACEVTRFMPKAKGGKGKGKGKGRKGGQGPSPEDVDRVWYALDAVEGNKDREFSHRVLEAVAMWREREVYIDLIEDLVHYIHENQPFGDGAILIFLPGWGDISKTYLRLYDSGLPLKIIALHSLMTPEQQHEAFEHPPPGLRKVILSTNIAEASVTIDDIIYVIDSGVMKERVYDPETGISTLDSKIVTRANAVQRRGRAGRCQAGLVYHLFPSFKMEELKEFPTPQMLSSSMEEVLLQSKVIHGGSNDDISAMLTNSMAAPKEQSVSNALDLLQNMRCLTPASELTVLGRAIAQIPVQPNVAKMLLLAGALRCIKPAAVVAAFLSLKNPFQQQAGSKASQQDGKLFFDKGYSSDHLTCLNAYVEWRREVARGRGDDYCMEKGLSPETLEMAFMMVEQFVNFVVEAGYDGDDVGEGDYGECDPVAPKSVEDALLRCAMTAGFYPNVCALYRNPNDKKAQWILDSDQEVSAFVGSINSAKPNPHVDGDEWMVFSDSMKMGRFNSIMDSSLVMSNFVLLFANNLLYQKQQESVFFDKWQAYTKLDQHDDWMEVLRLRKKFMPAFANCLTERDIGVFPKNLVDEVVNFVMKEPMRLDKLEPCRHIADAIEEQKHQKKFLSTFEWPVDHGCDDEDEEEYEEQ